VSSIYAGELASNPVWGGKPLDHLTAAAEARDAGVLHCPDCQSAVLRRRCLPAGLRFPRLDPPIPLLGKSGSGGILLARPDGLGTRCSTLTAAGPERLRRSDRLLYTWPSLVHVVARATAPGLCRFSGGTRRCSCLAPTATTK
jgi:hypothetical protein